MKLLKGEGFLIALLAVTGILLHSCGTVETDPGQQTREYPAEFTITRADLLDKIKGGWAGQVIGCTFGGPTEFQYNGTMIQDYVPIPWSDTLMEFWYTNIPGLYDDVYMDLTFVEVFEKEGLDAPATSHARAFAHAGYMLWHANQAARYNILNGLEPPASGHWENNPHADDIDFQIEADFAGLMNPGMVNSASEVCDRVGHIMNYGDGWYGGVYVAAMYALSFWSDDVKFIVREGLRTIPEQSDFYKCISDVIGWHDLYPDDWKRTWFETERKWSSDIGCPDGVFVPFNIDAKINAAYIVIGLLYGGGDFGKTVDISTRCGQDSDCNPASAGGILGTLLGYEAIPAYWKQGLDRVEDMDFKYTTISLNDTYDMGFRQAVEMVKRNGGEETEDGLKIRVQEPRPVKFEKAFDGHYPVDRIRYRWRDQSLVPGTNTEHGFSFSGKGFVLKGWAAKEPGVREDLDLELEVYIDGILHESALLPTGYQGRRHELTWKYNLDNGKHQVRVLWKNPTRGYRIDLGDVIVYGPEPSL